MAELVVRVPELGDFHDVDVVEVLVAVGDRVERDQSLIVLESDKASMEVPAPAAGVVESIAVRVNGKVNEGDTILTLRTDRANADSVNARAEPPYYADVSYRSITTQAVQIMLFCAPTPGSASAV